MRYRLERLSLLLLLSLATAWAEDSKPKSVPPFTGKVHLPVSLKTSEGKLLKIGPFDLELRVEDGSYSLSFLSSGTEKTVTRVEQATDPQREEGLGYPLVGTIHLRSTADPVGTDAERHRSKTGLPQYQEEPRRWDATLRMYRLQGGANAISILFHQNRHPDPIHARFQLFVADPSDTP